MRFLEKEKVLIVVLFHLGLNLNKIAKVVHAFRRNDSISDLLISFGNNPKVCNVLTSFKLPFNPARNKATSRNAVKRVVDKWLSASTIQNFKRTNFRKAISNERIKFLCGFVKER